MGHHHTPRVRRITVNAAGVTAVELTVVIVIVVVLAAVALFSVSGIRERQSRSACRAELQKMQTAVEAYRALPRGPKSAGTLPRDVNVLKAAGLLDARAGKYVAYERVRSGGHFVARYGNGPKGNCLPTL